MSVVPSSRKQVWLARGVLLVLAALFLFLKLSKFEISRSEIQGTTVYSPPFVFPIIFGVLGIAVGAMAVVFWMQGRIYRILAPVLALLSLFVLFNTPTGMNHSLIVTPHSFELRIGSWYSPVDTKVEFASLAYLSVDEAKAGDYELRALTRTGNKISVPICDLLKRALPDVLERAARHDVVIGDNADGWQIPPALRH